MVVVQVEAVMKELVLADRIIVAGDGESATFQSFQQSRDGSSGKFRGGGDEVQIFADSVANSHGQRRTADESKSGQCRLRGEELPDPQCLRRELARIHAEYS